VIVYCTADERLGWNWIGCTDGGVSVIFVDLKIPGKRCQPTCNDWTKTLNGRSGCHEVFARSGAAEERYSHLGSITSCDQPAEKASFANGLSMKNLGRFKGSTGVNAAVTARIDLCRQCLASGHLWHSRLAFRSPSFVSFRGVKCLNMMGGTNRIARQTNRLNPRRGSGKR